MVDPHPDDTRSKELINRRQYLQAVTGAVGAATVVGTGAAAITSEPAIDTVVDLGDKGLSEGDIIDEYLQEYVADGVEVRIPEGEYGYEARDGALEGASSDAAIIGDGEVILNHRSDSPNQTIEVESGTVAIKNLTFRGEVGPDKSRIRLEAREGGQVLVDNLNFPDGSIDEAESKAFYVPGEHAGVIEIRNCYLRGFADNGIYASSPGDGADGRIIIENTVAHNNNVSGLRVGSTDSVVRNCLVINDAEAPSQGGDVYQRGIRVREPGDNITIEGCEVIHSYEGAGPPIELHDGAEGGSGTIAETEIQNDSDSPAINGKGDTASAWTATNVDITGSGNMEYPSNFEGVTVGEDATAPSGDDPQQDGTSDSDSTDTTSSDSTDSTSSDSTDTTSSDSTDTTSSDSDSTDTSTPYDHQLVIETYADPRSGINYEFTADGEVHAPQGEDNDTVTDNGDGTWTVTGTTGGGYSDEFWFNGSITAWSAETHPDEDSGEYVLVLDGEEVDPATLTETESDGGSTSTDDALPNTLLVDGTASRGASTYELTVTGDIEPSADLSSAPEDGNKWDELEDSIEGGTVSGIVGKGLDGYRYSGDLVDFFVMGEVEVTNESGN